MKLNLALLNRLVDELNSAAKLVEQLENPSVEIDRIVELSKAMGIAAEISQESAMLVSDIKTLIKVPAKDLSAAEDAMKDIFGIGSKKKIDLQ